jgi:REP element-mobilizing transposase RayT
MSYYCLNYHIVYAVKDRRLLLDDDIMVRLCEYHAGIIRNLKGHLFIANGPANHIHCAVSIHPEISIVDFVRTLKANSSRWLHETFPELKDFAWQDGYSAFTISHSACQQVIEYIRGQKEHHKKQTFEEELVALLQRHNVKYDPQYIGG